MCLIFIAMEQWNLIKDAFLIHFQIEKHSAKAHTQCNEHKKKTGENLTT